MSDNEIKFIDRETGKLCTETVMGDKALRFAYDTLAGRAFWWGMFYTGIPSYLMGKYYDSSLSHKSIAKLANIPGLRLDEAEKNWQEYRSFNDFFTRRLKSGTRPVTDDDSILCSPADGRLMIYPNVDNQKEIPVKGAVRSLEYLCEQKLNSSRFHVAVVRLAPVDYHRFHYPCDCSQNKEPVKISGKYHSVNPIAFKRAPDVFVENTRCVTELNSEIFGKIIYIEVGAFGVGSIIQSSGCGKHKKMDEKGFFKFGGSTVILLLEADRVKIDDDLLANSHDGLETLVRCGNRIGTVC